MLKYFEKIECRLGYFSKRGLNEKDKSFFVDLLLTNYLSGDFLFLLLKYYLVESNYAETAGFLREFDDFTVLLFNFIFSLLSWMIALLADNWWDSSRGLLIFFEALIG